MAVVVIVSLSLWRPRFDEQPCIRLMNILQFAVYIAVNESCVYCRSSLLGNPSNPISCLHK